jgi:drug/metabolite transporter (DMT)-like permease
MIYLFLSIICSVALLLNFRLFPKYKVNTLVAISLNYWVCFITAFFLMPEGQKFNFNISHSYTLPFLLLGIGFILTFLLSGKSTQHAGMALTSIANNISLVIPVLVSIFWFQNAADFNYLNYIGLGLALIAMVLATYKGLDKGFRIDSSFILFSVFIFYGLTNTLLNYFNIKFILKPEETIPKTMVMLMGAIAAGVLCLIYIFLKEKKGITLKDIGASITLGIPNFLSFYFLLLALRAYHNNGALVYPLYNIGVIIGSSIVAIGAFKEKFSKINWIGLLLAVLAILLISNQGFINIMG